MLPRFSARLSEPRVEGLRRPASVLGSDLRSHRTRAPCDSAGPGQSCRAARSGSATSGRTASTAPRPLWEMTLVDGLEGGRWMLATKTHHAMLDGVGAMETPSDTFSSTRSHIRARVRLLSRASRTTAPIALSCWACSYRRWPRRALRSTSRVARAGWCGRVRRRLPWGTSSGRTNCVRRVSPRSTCRSARLAASRQCRSTWPR